MKKYMLTLIFFISFGSLAQSLVITKLEKDHPEMPMKYIYGSIIRAFAQTLDDELALKLVQDVQLIVYSNTTFDAPEQAQRLSDEIKPLLKQQGYKEIIQLTGPNAWFSDAQLSDEVWVYTLTEHDKISAAFIYRKQADQISLLDISGDIDLTGISSEQIASFSKNISRLIPSDTFNLSR